MCITMLVSSLPFRFVVSLLIVVFILTPSVAISIDKTCSTDDDCDLELMCNPESGTCTCPEPYFWRDDMNACFGCAPQWLAFETTKCLLFPVAQGPGATWYEARTTCEILMGQPMLIENVNDFISLQNQVKYLLDRNDILGASVYFRQGAWVQLIDQRTELYLWCNDDELDDNSNCVQLRQETETDEICLQHVACTNRSQFICEAPSLLQSTLQINLADAERANSVQARIQKPTTRVTVRTTPRPTIKATTQATIKATTRATIKATPQATIKATTQATIIATTRATIKATTQATIKATTRITIKATTKHTGNNGQTVNNLANTLTGGINAIGQVTNALGNSLSGRPNGNQNSNQQGGISPGQDDSNQGVPDALAQSDEEAKKKKLLLYGGIGGGAILLIVIGSILVWYFMNKKQKMKSSETRLSVDSSGSNGGAPDFE